MTARLLTLAALAVCALTGRAFAQQAPGAPPPQPLPHPELPPVPQPPEGLALWVWIVSSVLVLTMLALIFWQLLRARPLRPVLPANPRLETLRALRQLRTDAATQDPAETGHRVSVILRQYLQDRYRIPAPSRTTPELFGASAATPPPISSTGLLDLRPARTAKRAAPAVFAPLAELWDRLAFAPLPATKNEALALVESAIKRIEEDPA